LTETPVLQRTYSNDDALDAYERHVNPQWARLLDILQMNVEYVRCEGAELHSSEGRLILDFNSGYCVHNIGHNHPRLIAALKQELDRAGPAMLQSHVSNLAGELAEKLCKHAGGRLSKAFFACSGSEGVETVIKFARAHTKRAGILYAANGFHGLTCGALSLMSNEFWRDGFGPLLPETESVPFGDLEALERKLVERRFAVFVLEPIQGEGGIRLPPPDYLITAQELCQRYGTLLALDEVQTGFYRTGRFLAAHHFGVEPDMVILAKAMSGGLVPCSAVLMSDEVCNSIYSSLKRAFIHTSTYSENSLAMRAGLTTLEILEDERLGAHATTQGEKLRRILSERLGKYEMISEVRGLGLLSGIEFKAPRSFLLRAPFESFGMIHPGMFGQVVVMRLFRDQGVLSQICGNDFMTLKVAPPLTVNDAQIDRYASAIEAVVDVMHSSPSFWSEALGMARRVLATI
jgi:ornithine--oxo-acid transaminase